MHFGVSDPFLYCHFAISSGILLLSFLVSIPRVPGRLSSISGLSPLLIQLFSHLFIHSFLPGTKTTVEMITVIN